MSRRPAKIADLFTELEPTLREEPHGSGKVFYLRVPAKDIEATLEKSLIMSAIPTDSALLLQLGEWNDRRRAKLDQQKLPKA